MAIVFLKQLSFLCLHFILISQATAQPSFVEHYCMNEKGNYTANSTYQSNLNTLLSTLPNHTEINYGFYNFSYGQSPNTVSAIGLCRGDVKPDDCRTCLNDSRVLLPQLCPNQKEAIGWYDDCMLRYSHRSIFNTMESVPYFYRNNTNATDVDQFNEALTSLMNNLTSNASSGDSRRKFAVGKAANQTIYGLVQCTPDLSELECNECLAGAISEMQNCCKGWLSSRFVTPSCYIRYDNNLFYDPTAEVPTPSPPPTLPPSTNNTSGDGKSNTSGTVIAIVVPIFALVGLLILIFIYLRVRKSKKKFDNLIKHFPCEAEDDEEIGTTESLLFDFDMIRVATNDFLDANKQGQCGFGAVYHGKLHNGKEIAVKRLSINSGQGHIEFKNEVLLLAKLQHRNLVRLLGFFMERGERLLVYEFVPNKSLDYFIFDPIMPAQLDWTKCYKILGGIARGLLYLHEDSRLRIIHRDLKANNILLDEKMNAKISDFGIGKLFVMDQTQGNTRNIAGTYEYMTPEYVMHGYFSVKSDIFSFDVLILEIITVCKNNSILNGDYAEHLVSFAWKYWREGTASNIIDPKLNIGSQNEIMRCIHLGLLCVQGNAADRPTMATVVLMLNSPTYTLLVPSEPAFFMHGNLSNMQPWEYNSGQTGSSESKSVQESINEASITELNPWLVSSCLLGDTYTFIGF